jgi:hypothetical protein
LNGSSFKIFIKRVKSHPQQPVTGDFQYVPFTFKVHLPQVKKIAACRCLLSVKGVSRRKGKSDMGEGEHTARPLKVEIRDFRGAI